MKNSVYIQTFGCQMNKLDSELIADALVQAGCKMVDTEQSAGVILLNACSVRQHAEERVYNRLNLLKKYKAANPDLIIGLVGCMAQKDKESAFKRIPHLDIVCGPHRYKTLVKLIEDARTKHKNINCTDTDGLLSDESPDRRSGAESRRMSGATDGQHAYIQAMRGCDTYCSYCIVPYVRGRETSRPIKDIIAEAQTLANQGVKDITLLGQNITRYQHSLPALLKALHNITELKHIGFITGHPAFVTDELLGTMASLPKIRRELHIPAQSGSDRILKLMNRGYTAKDYLNIVNRANRLMPDIKIISDFIVGFPAETDNDFRSTVDLVKAGRFAKIFVFKYSPRPGTAAAKMPDDVPMATKKERNNLLLQIQKEQYNSPLRHSTR
jgi:tRNA-2-methylthio-N6-dimethylallyladenosine synthase